MIAERGIRAIKVHDYLRDPAPGFAVLVDRLWPRGIRKADLACDWYKTVAPSPELRKWFGHREDRFEAFAAQYQDELDEAYSQQLPELADLRDRAEEANAPDGEPLILLYAAKDREHNHALVLARWLERHLR